MEINTVNRECSSLVCEASELTGTEASCEQKNQLDLQKHIAYLSECFSSDEEVINVTGKLIVSF